MQKISEKDDVDLDSISEDGEVIRPRLAAEEEKYPENAATNGVLTVGRLHEELVKLRPTEQEMVQDR